MSKKTKIDTSSCEKFNETYKQYYLDTVKFNKQEQKLQYVLLCHEYCEMFFLEGYSMEEIYFNILFKINYNSCDDIYCYEYPLKVLKDPIKLLKTHFFDTNNYTFEEVKFINCVM
jgi:hypothetical protein